MLDHAKQYFFDVIELTMRANENCLTNLNFRETLMKMISAQHSSNNGKNYVTKKTS